MADHFDLRLTDMSSKRRPRSVALPRQVAMVLCRKLTRASLTEIADSFNKTHATVVHACKMIKFVMEPTMIWPNKSTLSSGVGRDQGN